MWMGLAGNDVLGDLPSFGFGVYDSDSKTVFCVMAVKDEHVGN